MGGVENLMNLYSALSGVLAAGVPGEVTEAHRVPLRGGGLIRPCA